MQRALRRLDRTAVDPRVVVEVTVEDAVVKQEVLLLAEQLDALVRQVWREREVEVVAIGGLEALGRSADLMIVFL